MEKSFDLQKILLGIINGYRRFVSPLFPCCCRFYPTCSSYVSDAVERHGVGAGVLLGIRRLFQCHPFCKGGYDPVPKPRYE